MKKLSLFELNRVGVKAFKAQPKFPITIVLDNIRSALNVGSFFRTADAFNAEKLHLCGICAQPPHKEIAKTAIGASESVSWEYHADITDCLAKLKKEDYLIFGIEQTDASKNLQDLQWPDHKIALVFGNEVNGISAESLAFLDQAIEIPQFGTKHSINVSVCGGIVMWSWLEHYLNTSSVPS